MSMYYCHECQQHIDDDYNPMVEHPFAKRLASYKGEYVCDECSQVLEYDMKEALREDLNDG